MGRTHPGHRRRGGAILLAALLALSLLGGCTAEHTSRSPAAYDRKTIGRKSFGSESIAGFLRRTLPQGASGTVIAARGDRLVHCAGFGSADRAADRAAGIPAGCRTVYDVMSVTKQFTAAAVLKLQTMGRLDVDDPISRHLGPVPGDKKSITVEHLLTHTSGLPESLGDDYAPVSRDQLVRRALASKLGSAPGKEFHYSNTGYSLLAAIIEKTSGQGYEPFLARHLFAPAGMKHTGYVLPRWPRHRIAVEYDSRQHSNVLPAHARRQLFTPRVPIPGSADSAAYGWIIRTTPEEPLAWHDGGNGWSLAILTRSLRDGVLVYWVSNHAYRKGKWNFEDLAETLTEGVAERSRTGG
ncbi:beta-lactamase family protein [Streptomyces sp. NBC_01381]|uniref:serine hydrolase domain-containing protein n=1 Tax=Streptomyces sp. NBC_01381 TaxID=2903845 RepID=UPI00225400E5|nr:serine hydrolase domain-containing protein [Streptomyces sp. NBC_01381]MCX4673365.1 beta-lactamase family protein [Streptomyces sp. NBC_01381]